MQALRVTAGPRPLPPAAGRPLLAASKVCVSTSSSPTVCAAASRHQVREQRAGGGGKRTHTHAPLVFDAPPLLPLPIHLNKRLISLNTTPLSHAADRMELT